MAHIFTALSLIVAAFQVALAFGAPWGELTWGGKFRGILPARMRVMAIISAVLIIMFALIIETRAGNILDEYRDLSTTLSWIVVAYSAIGTVMNAITPSKKERYLWLPIVTLLFFTSLFVTLAD